jgi:hypothetical protein
MNAFKVVVAFARRAAREPFAHFLAVALVLFGLNALLNPSAVRPSGDEILVTEGRIRQIAEGFRLTAGRTPDEAELKALVDDFVAEEIAYREALAMGLDVDDTVVRRRLRQKLDFLHEDVSSIGEPSEADLKAWLAANAERYATPDRRSIRQVLASADRRGAAARTDAEAMLAQLRRGEDPAHLGDPSLSPAITPLTTEAGLAVQFGADFARAVFAASDETWFGPVASPFGEHLVLVLSKAGAVAPELETIRDRVRADWIDARRVELRAERQAALRQRYDVTVEWPADAQALADAEK